MKSTCEINTGIDTADGSTRPGARPRARGQANTHLTDSERDS